jgi:hypothetical protein
MPPVSPNTMNNPVSPHLVACLILGSITPLAAQNLSSSRNLQEKRERIAETATLPGSYELPRHERVRGEVSEKPPIFTEQSLPTLEPKLKTARSIHRADGFDVLGKPTPQRRMVAATRGQQRYEVATDSLQNGLSLVASLYREIGRTEEPAACDKVALSISQQVKLEPSRLLEIVEREVAANPGCVCEIVKAAINAGEHDGDRVVSIVETAIHAAPESMRIISQCAIAAAPGSVSEVQTLLSRLDPNSGESGHGAKSAKGSKTAPEIAPPVGDPLDRPPSGPPLPPLDPRPVTRVNP